MNVGKLIEELKKYSIDALVTSTDAKLYVTEAKSDAKQAVLAIGQHRDHDTMVFLRSQLKMWDINVKKFRDIKGFYDKHHELLKKDMLSKSYKYRGALHDTVVQWLTGISIREHHDESEVEAAMTKYLTEKGLKRRQGSESESD